MKFLFFLVSLILVSPTFAGEMCLPRQICGKFKVTSVSKARLNCSDFLDTEGAKSARDSFAEVEDCILELESKSDGATYKVFVNKSKCKLKVSQQIEISFKKAFTDVFPPFKCTDTVPRKLNEPKGGANGVRKAMDAGAYLDSAYKD